MASFEDDARAVVDAITEKPYSALSDRTLDDLVGFSVEQQAAAEKTKASLLARQTLTEADPRALIAGAWLAFSERPEGFESLEAGNERSIGSWPPKILVCAPPPERSHPRLDLAEDSSPRRRVVCFDEERRSKT